MAAAMLDRAAPYSPQMHDWVQESSEHFQNRLAGFVSPGGDHNSSYSHLPGPLYLYPQSIHSSSSMAPMHRQYCASTDSNYPPSLTFCHTQTDTITDSSICTSFADQFPGFPPLEEVDGVLFPQFPEVRAPVYGCVFWFLNCRYSGQDRNEWKRHCLSHFHGEDPPRSVMCPLCDWETSLSDGSEAWDLRMRHLADEHFAIGHTLSTSRPDFHLFQHLWQKRLIGDQDLKELKGGNHNLTRTLNNFVVTQGRGPVRERHGRGVGRQRLQHIPEGQTRCR